MAINFLIFLSGHCLRGPFEIIEMVSFTAADKSFMSERNSESLLFNLYSLEI